MNDFSRAQVDLIREAFHYQSRFDGTCMVFKVDFPVTEDPGFSFLMKDLALLAKTGIRIIIVPGAKEWIDSVLHEYDIVSSYAGQIRITEEAAIPFVKMAAFDVATRFMTELSASRVDAVIGNFVQARCLGVVDGVDYGHSGMVEKIGIDSLHKIMEAGMVPILPCIGWSVSGKPYNLPSDEIALAVCKALKAVKFFVVSAEEGIHPGTYQVPQNIQPSDTGRLARLTPQEALQILEMNTGKQDRNLVELELALKASRSGVERVHIIDGRDEGAVLRELFSNLGVGTMVYRDEYESLRQLEADDIPEILRLMTPLIESGFLVHRSPEDIRAKLSDYVVYEIDGSIHACGALHDWGEGQGEIAAIATDPAYAEMGLGKRVIRYLVEKARRQDLQRVFVLTTRTHDWFELLGFKEVAVDSLPIRKKALYDKRRKSKVLALEINNSDR